MATHMSGSKAAVGGVNHPPSIASLGVENLCREEVMKKSLSILRTLLLLVFSISRVDAANIDLLDWGLNINGTTYCLVGPCDFDVDTSGNITGPDDLPPFINTSGFDFLTGLGELSITITDPGGHSVLVYVDHDIDDPPSFDNETAVAAGFPAAGQTWEIDEPGFGSSQNGSAGTQYFGDIFSDNFLMGALDNQRFFDAFDNQSLTPPDDVSMAMSRNFDLVDGETATVVFRLTETSEPQGFYLKHSDPDSAADIYFSASLVVENLLYESGVQAFVTRFYQQCLNRDPDSAGLDYWVNGLLGGTLNGADVAWGFVFSQEFIDLNTTNEEYLEVLYRAFFDRQPDAGGLAYWLDAFDNGASRGDILDGFLYAQEFYNLCYNYGISPNLVSAFVKRFYQQCLNRDPDQPGLEYWTNSLLSGTLTGADVASGFVFSQEFTSLNTSNEDYLTVLYRAFFDRQPDSGGFAFWLSELNSGMSREAALCGFVNSVEFGTLCYNYGIVPGGCGGSSSNIVKVVINEESALFTESNQSKPLSAKAFNAAGEELDLPVTWRSTNPDDVTVNHNGVITSLTNLGSASIIAQAGGVESAPFIAVIAKLADPDTVIVKDANVVGIDLVDPDAPLSSDTRYRVTLTDVAAPDVGDIILGTDDAPVYGRVVGVITGGDTVTVTLEIPPVHEVFSELDVQETIDLSQIEPRVPDSVSQHYAMEKQADGALVFSLKNQPASAASTALFTGALDSFHEIFNCEGDTSILTIDALPLTMTLKPDMDFIFAYHSVSKEFDSRIKGSVEASVAMTPMINLTTEAKIECKTTLVEVDIPVLGALQWVFGPSVPMGFGFEIGGKTTFGQLGVELKGTVGGMLEAGLKCPEGEECYSVRSSNSKLEYGSKLVFPDLSNTLANARIEPWAYGFAVAELRVGIAEKIKDRLERFFGGQYKFDFFSAKLGPKLSFNLATVTGQILDPGYKSVYGNDVEFVIGTTTDTKEAFKFLKENFLINVNVIKLEFKATLPLSGSPTVDDLTTDVNVFREGDKVVFNVNLNPSSVHYAGGVYNIDEIRIYEKDDISPGVYESRLLTSIKANPGQIDFTLEWTADFDGEVDESLFAFVVTNLLPSIETSFFDGLGALELGDFGYGTTVFDETSCPESITGIIHGQSDPVNIPFSFFEHRDYDYEASCEYTQDVVPLPGGANFATGLWMDYYPWAAGACGEDAGGSIYVVEYGLPDIYGMVSVRVKSTIRTIEVSAFSPDTYYTYPGIEEAMKAFLDNAVNAEIGDPCS